MAFNEVWKARMAKKRIVVTGGRDFSARSEVQFVLDAINQKYGIAVLIEGGAQGADRLCAEWAEQNSVKVVRFSADWDAHGKGAGPIRNQKMIDDGKPDAAVAFTGGRGTANMVGKLKAADIPLWDRRYSTSRTQASSPATLAAQSA